MKTLIINQTEVQQLLTMKECIAVVGDALKNLTAGKATMPLRSALWLPEKKGALGLMPAICHDPKSMGIKVVSVFPENTKTEYDSHQGVVILFNTQNGNLISIIDASSITAIRTAAASALATDLLAPQDAEELAIMGSGVQARKHLEAMLLIRPIKRVKVWSRDFEHAQELAKTESAKHDVSIEPYQNVEDTVRNADIICTTTAAREPVLFASQVKDNTHINAVGACVSSTRELGSDLVTKSRFFVDCCESALNESGDFLIPKKEGKIGDDHIAGEIGEVLAGTVTGRRTSEEITIFKSLGIAVEDLFSAEYIYNHALDKGIGTFLEIGGTRHA
jgi:ornithine cyclodeaminase